MRTLVLLAALLFPAIATADRAEIRTLANGGQAVFVDGRLAWPTDGRRVTITTDPRWAGSKKALAVVSSQSAQGKTLVVLVVDRKGAKPQAVEWKVPTSVPSDAVMWLGPQKVAVGPDELAPKMIANFDLR
jgi:hypothetical protein